MQKKRLLKLADLLEADAKNKKGVKFDLSTVGEASSFDADFQPGLDCGTTACAMGLAALSGAFKKTAGLSFKIRGRQIHCTIEGRERRYDRAAMAVFAISLDEADFLFTPMFYRNGTPRGGNGERLVAKRIRDFVAGKVSPNNDW